jgi:hypothetical protein
MNFFKKFFYLYLDPEKGIKMGFCQHSKYEDAVNELKLNNVNVLFLSSYSSLDSRMVYKYLMVLLEERPEELLEQHMNSLRWEVTQPWLFFQGYQSQFVTSPEMMFDRSLKLVGYVTSKAILDILCKTDLI